MTNSSDDLPERDETIRQRLRKLLEEDALTARELSALASLEERAVAVHLEHLRRSLAAEGVSLQMEPARCKQCGFVFEQRARPQKPGRCPSCKAQRIEPPRFWVA